VDIKEVLLDVTKNGYPAVATYTDWYNYYYGNSSSTEFSVAIPILGAFELKDEFGYEIDTVVLMWNENGADLPYFYSWNDDNSYSWTPNIAS
jgi:hypothetical protein